MSYAERDAASDRFAGGGVADEAAKGAADAGVTELIVLNAPGIHSSVGRRYEQLLDAGPRPAAPPSVPTPATRR